MLTPSRAMWVLRVLLAGGALALLALGLFPGAQINLALPLLILLLGGVFLLLVIYYFPTNRWAAWGYFPGMLLLAMGLILLVNVVTGSTSGIGLAVAQELVSRGANLLGVGRSADRCQATEASLQRLNPHARIAFFQADLSLQSQVLRLAQEIRGWLAASEIKALDGLVNNAGTFTFWMALTAEGFETQWAVNHLAAFLLTRELLPLLQAAPAGRVVTVSSDSHHGTRLNWQDIQLRRSYNGLRAYGQSKLANILFTLELNRRMRGHSNLRAFAADPGLVKTEIGFKGTPPIVRWVWNLRRSAGIPPEEAGRGIAFLVSAQQIQDSPEIYWKHGRPTRASRQALDKASAARLWAISEQMCSLRASGGAL